MTNQTEVEFIGLITKEKFNELKGLFSKEGKFKKEKERLSLMYFRDGKIPKDISEIKDELVDLRFRVTNKQPEIVLKYGNFTGSHARKEVSIKPDEPDKHIEFLNLLGWNKGVIYATKTFVYTYHDIEFSLIEIKDYGYNFEAEILTEESKIEEAKNKIKKELTMLNLKELNEEDLNKQCNAINNKKELRFDFSKETFEDHKKRFSEFY